MAVTKLTRALAASILVLSLAACGRRGDGFETVSIDDVERMLGEPDVTIIDANTAEVFRRAHLPGAVRWRSAPLAQLLPAEKDRRIVFYCASPS